MIELNGDQTIRKLFKYAILDSIQPRGNKGTSCDDWHVEHWHKVWEL